MSRRRLLLGAILALLVIVAVIVVLLASSGGPQTPVSPVVSVPSGTPAESVPTGAGFDGAAVPEPKPAPGFSLTDQYGRRVSLSSLRGGPVVLAFLYARCGGPCVLIAQQIRGALDELGEHPVQVAIVSADPAADTPDAVRAFLAQVSLSGRVHYLTGPAAELAAVWKAYDVRPAADGIQTFAKYATVHLLDAQGRERVLYGTEQLTPEALSHDIRKLQSERGGA
jgi:protein SCO1/2